MDEDDKPVSAAFVSAQGQRNTGGLALTDAAGKFTIQRLCEGSVEVMVQVPDRQLSASVRLWAGDQHVTVVVKKQRRP